jgi:hypothetical protein
MSSAANKRLGGHEHVVEVAILSLLEISKEYLPLEGKTDGSIRGMGLPTHG